MGKNWTPIRNPEADQISGDFLSNALKSPVRTKSERRARMTPDERVIDAMEDVLERTTPDGIQAPKEEERNDSGRRRGEWLRGE